MRSKSRNRWWRWPVAAFLAVVPASLMAQSPANLPGAITAPDSDSIPYLSQVSGTLAGRSHHLWLVARIGDMNWPLAPATLEGTTWRTSRAVAVLGLPVRATYTLALIEVASEEANEMITRFLADSDRAGRYRPLLTRDLGGGARVLATRQYRTK